MTKSAPIAIEVSQPVQEGRTARRRLMIRPTTAPTAGEQVQLTLQPDAVRDLFLNPMSSVFQTTVTWPASGSEVVSDSADPEVEELQLRDGHLELILSEPPDLASASSAVQIDGSALSWTVEPDGYTLLTVAPLEAGAHTVMIAAGAPLDRAGKGVAAEFTESITVTAGVKNEEYFSLADPREVGMEALVNRFSFHGRSVDLETGLVYFRNRYYDPEMGRFVTADPLGLVDGPSMYQGFANSPLSYGDPLGLFIFTGPDGLLAFKQVLLRLNQSTLASSLRLDSEGKIAILGHSDHKWAEARESSKTVQAVYSVLTSSNLRIKLRIVSDDSLVPFSGAKGTPGVDHLREMFTGERVWTQEIAIDPAIIKNVRYQGEEGRWIATDFEIVMIHELGHPLGNRDGNHTKFGRVQGLPGPSDEFATEVEDNFRQELGLPLRGTHTRGAYCESGDWYSDICLRAMACVEAGYPSNTNLCRDDWERLRDLYTPRILK